MLTDILPARVRRATYVAYAVGVVILGTLAIILPAMGVDMGWHATASEAWLYLGAAVGAVAAGNTPHHIADGDGKYRAE